MRGRSFWVSQTQQNKAAASSLLLPVILVSAESRPALVKNPKSEQSETETRRSKKRKRKKRETLKSGLESKTSLEYDNTTAAWLLRLPCNHHHH